MKTCILGVFFLNKNNNFNNNNKKPLMVLWNISVVGISAFMQYGSLNVFATMLQVSIS